MNKFAKILLATLPITAYCLLLATTPIKADWPMAAANPERTSWVSEQVPATPAQLNLEAYRPIEPYIPQNVQIIAANNLIYVSTARGLYALYTSGTNILQTAWQLNTELPLGNSPTYANGVIYVAGYDRILYALNATTGAIIWQFKDAQAGYSTNPVVADGKVMLGNRDGTFYAINLTNGNLAWSYKTEGPINFSAAYKNGVVYFASMDNRGYALNTSNGTLVWKTDVMGGDGFNSYWPVIYTNPEDGQDYVIFSASTGYRAYSRPGNHSSPTCDNSYVCAWPEWADEWRYTFTGTFDCADYLATHTNAPITCTSKPTTQPWIAGKPVYDLSPLLQYFEERPASNPDPYWQKAYRRYYYIFHTSPGSNQTAIEWSMDSDNDGLKEYIPIDPIISNNGNVYPPVVMGNQDSTTSLLYIGNHFNAQTLIGPTMGWRMGTKYATALPFGDNSGDEPKAFSGGGNLLYRVICCTRVADWVDVTTGNNNGLIYSYGWLPNSVYDELWWYPAGWSSMVGLYGNYGNVGLGVNGIYNSHGDQNPPIPYNGKLFMHKANHILVYSTLASTGRVNRLDSVPVTENLVSPSQSQLIARLETEVKKIVDAGHLRPGYYNSGQQNETFPELSDYFAQPGDTLLALSRAYPWITDTVANNNLKTRLKTYLNNEFNNFTYTSWVGAKREWSTLPPEVEADMASGTAPVNSQRDSYYNYALWKYVELVDPTARAQALTKTTTTQSNLEAPYGTYRNIAGTIGLAYLNNQTPSYSCPTFSKDSPYTQETWYNRRVLNISRNFMFMVPELAERCYAGNATVLQALSEYEKVGPYWFVSRYTASVGEATVTNLYDYPSLFTAKAYIQNLPQEELTKWLDAPAFKIGDLYYIQNLTTAIEAPTSGGGSPTLSPTPTPIPGDANGDGHVDGVDYVIWLNNYGTSSQGSSNGDFDGSGTVDGVDYVIWLNNYTG